MPVAAALLALSLAAAAPPDAPGPLSPAGLPPPPAAAAGPITQVIGLSAVYGPLAEPIGDCTRKAVAAVAAQDGFRFVEVGANGVVTGYTATCRLAVVVEPGSDGSYFYVLVASWAGDSERVGFAIRDRVQATLHDPKTPRTVGTRDPALEKKLPLLAWHLEARPLGDLPPDALGRHFPPVAVLALEKRGFQPLPAAKGLFALAKDGRRQAMLAGMAGGVKGVSVNTFVLGSGEDTATVTRDAKAVCTSITKMLFE